MISQSELKLWSAVVYAGNFLHVHSNIDSLQSYSTFNTLCLFLWFDCDRKPAGSGPSENDMTFELIPFLPQTALPMVQSFSDLASYKIAFSIVVSFDGYIPISFHLQY